MKIFGALTFFLLAAAALAAEKANFDTLPTGKAPAGWTVTLTGSGEAKWTVENDSSAPSKPNVLKQSGTATYPICLKDDSKIKNGFVETKFKALSGKVDQAAGVIWRAADAGNYYVARANALENNVTIYHVVNGKRTEKKRVKIPVSLNEWHTFRVDFNGSRFSASLNAKPVLDWEDDTFRDAGMIGLWTKADSVTLFDDVTYGPLK